MATPLRPQSSYMHFVAAHKAAVALEHPTAQFFEIANILTERWGLLGTAEKAKYHELAKQDRARYRQELEQHRTLAAAGIRLRAAKPADDELLSDSGDELEEDTLEDAEEDEEDGERPMLRGSSGPPPAPAAVGPPARRREPSADATLSALGSTPFITAVPLDERPAGGEEEEEEEGEAGQPGPEPYNVGCATPEPASRLVDAMPAEYRAFINETRRAVAEQNPGLSYRQLARLVSEKWRTLTPEQRLAYRPRERTPTECLGIRDPNSLPGEQTARALYCRAERHALMQANPGLTYREAARLCMHGWSRLSEQERAFYAP